MRDEAIATKPGLSVAEAAVNYTLQRCRVDANLRYHMLGTEAFARLCEAEAQRTGKPVEEVRNYFSCPADHCRQERAKILELRDAAREVVDLCHSAGWRGLPIERLDILT